MKITDVSSLSSQPPPPEADSDAKTEDDTSTLSKRNISLLEKYNIPIEHLDFDFVSKCSDARKVERILRILRSGEEGMYEELEQCVHKRLEELNPKSKELRVDTPVIRSSEMEKSEREEISVDLTDWLNELSASSSSQSKDNSIFDRELEPEGSKSADAHENCPLPVRGSQQVEMVTHNHDKEERIKSWEYDKWDKFDVEKELTKMDICDMQLEEWEKREKPRLIQEQKEVEKLMRSPSLLDNKGAGDSLSATNDVDKIPDLEKLPKPRVSRKQSKRCVKMSVEEKSFVEEVNDSDDEDGEDTGIKINVAKTAPKLMTGFGRKTSIVIEDLNLGI